MAKKKPKLFKPNEKQLLWLETAANLDVKPTILAISQKSGIDRRFWYDWIERDDFVDWWNKAWDKVMQRHNWWLDRVGLAKSMKDYRYWEAMQMKYSKFRQKVDHTSDGEKITFGIMTRRIDENKPEPKTEGIS